MVKLNKKKVRIAMIEEDIPSARALARLSGVHESQLSYMLRGRMLPTVEQAGRIAKALDRDPQQLCEHII